MVSKMLLRASPLAIAIILSACGGGGGGGVGSTPPPPSPVVPVPPPPPPPTPVPPPPPPPPGTNYDTAEYRRSNGATSIGSITAYNAGATGSGIKVGVIDSGINSSLSEFVGKIDPSSRSTAGNADFEDEDGHGTAVAAVIAANKDDSGAHGVAFNSTLVVIRADKPGSCATEGTGDDAGCKFNESAIAAGVDAARLAGAKVINISLGSAESAGSTLRQAVTRATNAGIIIVVSAGNDGEETTGGEPDGFSASLVSAGTRGLVLISGALDEDNTNIAVFSNRAGNTTAANAYISALGRRVYAIDNTGAAFRWSGTSFSAPVTTGAIALLLQAFPNLSPEQVIQLIFTTARDLGTPGIDNIYGRGGLDLTRAFQPVGATSLAGSKVAVDPEDDGVLGEPMGDGGTPTPLATIITDGYQRAFDMNVGSDFKAARPDPTLAGLTMPRGQSAAISAGQTTLAVAVGPQGWSPIMLSGRDANMARATAGVIATKIGRNMDVSLGISQSSGNLVAGIEGAPGGAFLVAKSGARQMGFSHDAKGAVAVGYKLGSTQVTVGAEQGDVFSRVANAPARLRGRSDRFSYSFLSLSASRPVGPATFTLGVSQLDEDRTILGSRLSPVFGNEGARTLFVDGAVRANLGSGWQAGLAARRGWTDPRASGALTGGTLKSQSWSFDIGKSGVMTRDDKVAFRYAEPLRVRGGALLLALPTGYDYATESASYGSQRLALTPNGHARDWELAYTRSLWGGRLSFNGFYRVDRGNVEWMPNEVGGLLSYSLTF